MKFTELVDSGASKTKQHEYLVDGEQTAITIRIPSNLKDAYNNNFIIKDIPEAAQRYTVNGRNPLEWIIDRYQVKTDKASGIINDPNDYSDDPRYIVNLIEGLITVSVNTMEIVDGLPALWEKPQPENWLYTWKVEGGE